MKCLRAALRLSSDVSGAAAAELALVTPLLLTLLFGAFELGNYFLHEHVVAKAVRDGARYAARQSFSDYTGCAVASDVVDETRNLTRTGQVADGGEARLYHWTDETTIDVTVTCNTADGYQGIYRGNADGAPVVTVSATIPYSPLLAPIGIDSIGIDLNAESQSAVTGI